MKDGLFFMLRRTGKGNIFVRSFDDKEFLS